MKRVTEGRWEKGRLCRRGRQNTQMVRNRDNENREKKKERRKQGEMEEEEDKKAEIEAGREVPNAGYQHSGLTTQF